MVLSKRDTDSQALPKPRVTLLASGAITSTSAGTAAIRLPLAPNAVVVMLDVTVAATEVDDTLDFFIQTKMAGTWIDVIHFTQVLGNGGAKRFVAKLISATAEAEFETAAALGAGSIRSIIGDEWRTRYDIVDPGAGAVSFTVEVTAFTL